MPNPYTETSVLTRRLCVWRIGAFWTNWPWKIPESWNSSHSHICTAPLGISLCISVLHHLWQRPEPYQNRKMFPKIKNKNITKSQILANLGLSYIAKRAARPGGLGLRFSAYLLLCCPTKPSQRQNNPRSNTLRPEAEKQLNIWPRTSHTRKTPKRAAWPGQTWTCVAGWMSIKIHEKKPSKTTKKLDRRSNTLPTHKNRNMDYKQPKHWNVRSPDARLIVWTLMDYASLEMCDLQTAFQVHLIHNVLHVEFHCWTITVMSWVGLL